MANYLDKSGLHLNNQGGLSACPPAYSAVANKNYSGGSWFQMYTTSWHDELRFYRSQSHSGGSDNFSIRMS